MLQLAAALDRDRYAPVAVFAEDGPIFEFARELGVPARGVPMGGTFSYGAHVPIRGRMLVSFLAGYRSTANAAEALVREERPDLVHLNTSVLVAAAAGVARTGVPLVWHVREVPGPSRWIWRRQMGVICGRAAHIVANSEFVRRAYPPDAPVSVVHNALELERFRVDDSARQEVRADYGVSSETVLVGMLGSVQEVKGQGLLVLAMKEVVKRAPNIRALIVAGGVDEGYAQTWKGRVKQALRRPMDNLEAMKRQVAAQGLDHLFIFSGYTSDIPKILSGLDVLAVLPQAAEGFGRPLIEGMAMGLPIVATDIGPTREIVGEGSALLVPPGNASAVADALVRLAGDERERAALGRVGRQRAEAKFDMREHVARIEKIYESVL